MRQDAYLSQYSVFWSDVGSVLDRTATYRDATQLSDRCIRGHRCELNDLNYIIMAPEFNFHLAISWVRDACGLREGFSDGIIQPT